MTKVNSYFICSLVWMASMVQLHAYEGNKSTAVASTASQSPSTNGSTLSLKADLPDQISAHVEKKADSNEQSHKTRRYSKGPLSTEEFEKLKSKKIEELSALILKTEEQIKQAKDVSAVLLDEANLKVVNAKKWLETIRAYKDLQTRLTRSFHFAKVELDSVHKSLVPIKRHDRLNDTLDQLYKETQNLAARTPFHEENKIFILRLLENAKEYLDFIKKNSQSHPQFSSLADRAESLLKNAKKFIRYHQKHHFHDK